MTRVRDKQYKNNLELRALIINCISMGLKETEAIKYLTDKGYPVSIRTYRNQKQIIRSSRVQRLDDITKYEFIDAHLDALDNLKHIKEQMWIQYHNEVKPYAKTEILTQIANLEPYISEYYGLTKKIIENKKQEHIKIDKRIAVDSKRPVDKGLYVDSGM